MAAWSCHAATDFTSATTLPGLPTTSEAGVCRRARPLLRRRSSRPDPGTREDDRSGADEDTLADHDARDAREPHVALHAGVIGHDDDARREPGIVADGDRPG